MLAYQQGGASTPSGSIEPAQDILTPTVSTAMQAKRLSADIENLEATNKNINETNKNLIAERARIGSTTANINANTKILDQTLGVAIRDAAAAKSDEEFYATPGGRILRTIGTSLRELNPFLSRGNIHIRPTGN